MDRSAIYVDVPAPPKVLSPNARSHWAVKAKAVRKYKADVAYLAMNGHCPGWDHVEVRYTLRLGKGCKRWDGDNLIAAMKSGLDGLVTAGVLKDDKHVQVMPPEQVRAPANPGVTIRIEQLRLEGR